MNNKKFQKGKHQVNGQTYDWNQMTTANDKKGFLHVIRSPNISEDSYIFEIFFFETVSIYIEYMEDKPSQSIEKFMTYVLQHHTLV